MLMTNFTVCLKFVKKSTDLENICKAHPFHEESISLIVEPLVPSYARETVSSQQRRDLGGTGERREETPLFVAGYLRQSTDLALYDADDGQLLQDETPSPIMESVSQQYTNTAAASEHGETSERKWQQFYKMS
jgi:hypothetical protein